MLIWNFESIHLLMVWIFQTNYFNKGMHLLRVMGLQSIRSLHTQHWLEYPPPQQAPIYWVNFDVQCFTVKMGVHLGWKVSVLPQKGGSFWTEKSVFYREKSVYSCKKGGNFQTGKQGWVPLFPVSEGAGREPPTLCHLIICQPANLSELCFRLKLE